MSVAGSVRVHARRGSSGEKRENDTCGRLAASGSPVGAQPRGQNAPVAAIKSSNCFAKRMRMSNARSRAYFSLFFFFPLFFPKRNHKRIRNRNHRCGI